MKRYLLAALLACPAILFSSCEDAKKPETPEPEPPPVDEAIVMVNTTKVLYYGDRRTEGVYNYFFGLGDTEFIKDEQGDDAAPEGGHLVFFDVYADKGAGSFEDAVLPDGTYTLADSKAPGTMDKYYTRLQVWKDGKQVSIDFTEGKMEVTSAGDGKKSIYAAFTLKDGSSLACKYTGILSFGDPDAGSDDGIPPLKKDVNTVFTDAMGIYYGDEYGTGTDSYQISFSDVPLGEDNLMTGRGYNLILSIYAEPSDSFIALAPGTYTVEESYLPGTVEPGYFILDYGGSICVKVNDEIEADEIGLISGGSIRISESGMGYLFEFDLETVEGISIKGSYDGYIDFDDQSPEEIPNTTLTGDYVLDLSDANTVELDYYGDFYDNGMANWMLTIGNSAKDMIDIELITEQGSKTQIPLPEKGQYNMSVDNGIGFVAGSSDGFGMTGTWYLDMSTLDNEGYLYGYAAAIEGNVRIAEKDGAYTVSFEFVDELYNLFSGSWSGKIPDAVDKTQSISARAGKKSCVRHAARPAKRAESNCKLFVK